MPLTPYQIAAPIVSLVAVAYAWSLVTRQKKTIWEALLWTIFWVAISIIALYPDTITYLSAVTGIEDRENAVLVTFLGILFFVVFYLVIRLENMEQRQTRIVREIALREGGLGKKREEAKRN